MDLPATKMLQFGGYICGQMSNTRQYPGPRINCHVTLRKLWGLQSGNFTGLLFSGRSWELTHQSSPKFLMEGTPPIQPLSTICPCPPIKMRVHTHTCIHSHTCTHAPFSRALESLQVSNVLFDLSCKANNLRWLVSPFSSHNPLDAPQLPPSALMRAGTRTCLLLPHASLCLTHKRHSSKQGTERGKERGRGRGRKGGRAFTAQLTITCPTFSY